MLGWCVNAGAPAGGRASGRAWDDRSVTVSTSSGLPMQQVAALPFRMINEIPHFLLVTSRGPQPRWILPKGSIEKNVSRPMTAANEAREEAGVVGSVGKKTIGLWVVRKNGNRPNTRIQVYALEVQRVLKFWDERLERRRGWFTAAEASRLVAGELAQVIVSFAQRIETDRAAAASSVTETAKPPA